MKSKFVQKNKKALIAALIGAVAGGLYYYFVGCESGNCVIVSNPFIIIPYGALLGYLFAGIFTNKEVVSSQTNENS
jgi:hypothetical protein